MHVCIAFLSIFSMLDSSSLLSDGDFDVVSKLSSAALARADIKAFAKSKHNAMFLFLSIRLQHIFLTSKIFHRKFQASFQTRLKPKYSHYLPEATKNQQKNGFDRFEFTCRR